MCLLRFIGIQSAGPGRPRTKAQQLARLCLIRIGGDVMGICMQRGPPSRREAHDTYSYAQTRHLSTINRVFSGPRGPVRQIRKCGGQEHTKNLKFAMAPAAPLGVLVLGISKSIRRRWIIARDTWTRRSDMAGPSEHTSHAVGHYRYPIRSGRAQQYYFSRGAVSCS